MVSLSQNVPKIMITLLAGPCLLLSLLCLDWTSEGWAQDSTETDRPDLSPEEVSPEEVQARSFDGRHVEPRYLVTYMNSEILGLPRSATVVSVTNLSQEVCDVSVEWFRGFDTNNDPSCVTNFALDADITADFCSRDLPFEVTTCNSTCDPELDFHEGRAIVGASCDRIGLSSRVYYTGEDDTDLQAITDSKIVRLNLGNRGD